MAGDGGAAVERGLTGSGAAGGTPHRLKRSAKFGLASGGATTTDPKSGS